MSKIKSYAAPQAGAELELYEYDAGELKAEDVEVQVDYCGICHSDLSMIDNEWGFSSYPLVAGHEVIGRVVALGSAAQDKGLKVGQRVGIGWTARSCGHCDACISGNQINCLEGAVPTILNKGGFADKLRADWQWVIPLPDSIDIESAGPLLCGGITVFKPLLMHHITATSRVGVIGIGGLGHIAIKLLHAMGCEVTAFSSNPAKEKEVLAGTQQFQASVRQYDSTLFPDVVSVLFLPAHSPLHLLCHLDRMRCAYLSYRETGMAYRSQRHHIRTGFFSVLQRHSAQTCTAYRHFTVDNVPIWRPSMEYVPTICQGHHFLGRTP